MTLFDLGVRASSDCKSSMASSIWARSSWKLSCRPLISNNNGFVDCLHIDELVTQIVAGSSSLRRQRRRSDRCGGLGAWLSAAGGFNLGSWRSYLIGAANLDGVVDGSDFIIWNSRFAPGSGWCGGGNFRADGVLHGANVVLWNTYKFQMS